MRSIQVELSYLCSLGHKKVRDRSNSSQILHSVPLQSNFYYFCLFISNIGFVNNIKKIYYNVCLGAANHNYNHNNYNHNNYTNNRTNKCFLYSFNHNNLFYKSFAIFYHYSFYYFTTLKQCYTVLQHNK